MQCRALFALACLTSSTMSFSSVMAADDAATTATGTITIKGAQVGIIQEVPVAAGESGLVAEVLCKPGQVVEAGSLLAKLDATAARLKLNEAQFEFNKAREAADADVEIRAAQKSLEVARAELKRAQEAIEKYSKAISKTEIDRLRLTTERAALAIEQAELTRRLARFESSLRENQVAIAEHTLKKHQIHTPITGVVLQSNHHVGEWVEIGKPVFRILQLDRLRCERRVDAALVDRSMIGRRVEVVVQLPNKKTLRLPATLAFVDAQISPIKGDVLVWAEFDNPHLVALPGMKADIEILDSSELAESAAPKRQ